MAGWVHHGRLTDLSDEDWQRSFQINVDSMFYVLRAALPKMLLVSGGSVVNMASLASSVKGFACPGTIESESLKKRNTSLAEELGDANKARAWFVDCQPMKRLGQPDEIAKLILYLLSDDGAYATGQSFIIDGGTTA